MEQQIRKAEEEMEVAAGEVPEESNDELLDQVWDDQTGASLDAKKVKEARQLEMECCGKMHVWEMTGEAPLKARCVDIDKGTRCRSRWAAKQFKGSDSEEWFAAAPPIEALRALISHTMSGPKKKALMACDVSRPFFHAPVQHETHVELCEEAKKTVEDNNMCAKLRMSMYGDQGRHSKFGKRLFKKRWPHLVSQSVGLHPFCSVITAILGDGPGMPKEVKILNRKLCWHDGVGIEADGKHAEAIICETGASNLTSLKISMSKREQGGSARQNRRHCGEEKIGKVGHEGTATDRTVFEPCRNHSV